MILEGANNTLIANAMENTISISPLRGDTSNICKTVIGDSNSNDKLNLYKTFDKI